MGGSCRIYLVGEADNTTQSVGVYQVWGEACGCGMGTVLTASPVYRR